ncbi:MAG TPA: trigger factor [Acidimicrobiales bacterium]|nr:trigger factor [Acidimicrobiales bacterium]
MQADVEPLEGNKVKLSVQVADDELEKAIDAAFRKIARDAKIPGFRPGKAPRRLLEAKIGAGAAREEALRDALPEFYVKAIRQADIDAIAPPEIEVTSGREDGPLAFDAVVEIRPQVSVVGYEGIEVTIPSPEVGDEEIARQIDRLRAQGGELQTVGRPAQSGDFVSIDIKGEHEGEAVPGLTADDYLYELGSGTVVPELDTQLAGGKPGDIFAFDADAPDGTPLGFRVLVKEVKERVLPEVTDEWAQEASEFDTVAELRDDLVKRLSMVKKVQARMALRDQALRGLIDLVSEDAPEPLVASELERRLHDLGHRLQGQGATVEQYLEATGQDADTLVAEMREGAIEAVKADLGLRALADRLELVATDDDVEAEVAQLAERMGEKPAAVMRQLDRADQVPAVRSDIRKTKALEWLVDHVSVVDEEGRPVERSALDPIPEVAAAAESDA